MYGKTIYIKGGTKMARKIIFEIMVGQDGKIIEIGQDGKISGKLVIKKIKDDGNDEPAKGPIPFTFRIEDEKEICRIVQGKKNPTCQWFVFGGVAYEICW
jgi:hypothetical protein